MADSATSLIFVSTSVTSAGISGSTLTVTVSGGSTFTYQLAGQEANTGAIVQSDGAGGTDVTLVTETSIVSSGHTLVFSSGQTSNGIVVLSGGTIDVLSGGVASSTIVNSGGREIVSAHGTDDGSQISGRQKGLRLCQWRHGFERRHTVCPVGWHCE